MTKVIGKYMISDLELNLTSDVWNTLSDVLNTEVYCVHPGSGRTIMLNNYEVNNFRLLSYKKLGRLVIKSLSPLRLTCKSHSTSKPPDQPTWCKRMVRWHPLDDIVVGSVRWSGCRVGHIGPLQCLKINNCLMNIRASASIKRVFQEAEQFSWYIFFFNQFIILRAGCL